MKFLYFCTTGSGDPTRASVPLHLAVNGSVPVGQETTVILGGDATELIFPDVAGKVEGVGIPPMRELLAKLKDHSVPVYV